MRIKVEYALNKPVSYLGLFPIEGAPKRLVFFWHPFRANHRVFQRTGDVCVKVAKFAASFESEIQMERAEGHLGQTSRQESDRRSSFPLTRARHFGDRFFDQPCVVLARNAKKATTGIRFRWETPKRCANAMKDTFDADYCVCAPKELHVEVCKQEIMPIGSI